MAEISAAMKTYKRYAEIRDAKKMTDYGVAKAANVGRNTISAWKQAVYTPKYDKILKISEVLGVDPRLIMEG